MLRDVEEEGEADDDVGEEDGIGLCGCDTEVNADGPRADKERLLDGDMEDDEGRDDGEEEHDVEADNAAAAAGDASTLSVDICLPTNLRSECECDCGDAFTDGEWCEWNADLEEERE